ncbi:DNA pilot protein [Sigmofec virus UA08Rod_6143]|uniref:DNA pilot protein n=1 Tax=Sigmofec virus UA08Rod_6143 TaxID=2929223 RepID=A0A976R570_9VIRU|nr:DNA pilot protein [Sigmofec virus UA08Rod_6143]
MGFKLSSLFKGSSDPDSGKLGKLTGKLTNVATGNYGALFGDILSAAAPAVGAYLSYNQQKDLLDRQYSFQERMSNTAHQREVNDLLAAGINPLYTATGGNGASTPLGATGSATDFANAFSQGIGRAYQNKMQRAQVQAMDFENALRKQNVIKGTQEARLIKEQADNYHAELNSRLKLNAAQTYSALQSGAASSAQATYNQEMALMAGLDRMEKGELWKFLNENPEIKKLYMTSYGVGNSFGRLIK